MTVTGSQGSAGTDAEDGAGSELETGLLLIGGAEELDGGAFGVAELTALDDAIALDEGKPLLPPAEDPTACEDGPGADETGMEDDGCEDGAPEDATPDEVGTEAEDGTIEGCEEGGILSAALEGTPLGRFDEGKPEDAIVDEGAGADEGAPED